MDIPSTWSRFIATQISRVCHLVRRFLCYYQLLETEHVGVSMKQLPVLGFRNLPALRLVRLLFHLSTSASWLVE